MTINQNDQTKSIDEITFLGKSFCITGGFAEYQRKEIEKEVLKRGGFVSDRMNKEVDYLILGSVPNPAWKFGNYGNKIETAIALRNLHSKPEIVSETDFIDCLSISFPTKDEHQEEALTKVTYEFWNHEDSLESVKVSFDKIANQLGFNTLVDDYTYSQIAIFDNSRKWASVNSTSFTK